MDSQSLLQTHAEVAMAIGGFASFVAALGRPIGAMRRQRFLALLLFALVQFLTVASVIVLPVNAIGAIWKPGSEAYYSNLLLAFWVGFMICADVVIGDHVRQDPMT
jgi:hypothetical protein